MKNAPNIFTMVFLFVLTSFLVTETAAQHILAGEHIGSDIYYYDLDPDENVRVTDPYGTEVHHLDMDGDGTDDMRVQVDTYGGGGGFNASRAVYGDSIFQVSISHIDTCTTNSGAIITHSMATAYDLNDTINAQGSWMSSGNLDHALGIYIPPPTVLCSDGNFDATDRYVGIRKIGTPDTLYGWIKVNLPTSVFGVNMREHAIRDNAMGIADNAHNGDAGISVYPNPTDGRVRIDMGQEYRDVNVAVCDITGKHVATYNFGTTAQFSFELNGAKGLYVIEVSSAQGRTARIRALKY